MKKLLLKAIGVVIMVAAPIISFKAFYEYVQVSYFHHQPTYPFGKSLMHGLQHVGSTYLNAYAQELLTIGIVFLVIAAIAYLAMLVKTMLKLVWFAALSALAYYVYIKLK